MILGMYVEAEKVTEITHTYALLKVASSIYLLN